MKRRLLLTTVIVALATRVALAQTAPPAAKPEFKPKPYGYIEAFFLNDQSDAKDKATAQFKVRRARIGLKGDAHERISYDVQGAFEGAFKSAVTEVSLENPGTAEEKLAAKKSEIDSNARLWNAYIDFKPHALANVRVGQFKYPFTLEGLEGTPARAPIVRAEAINGIAGKLGSKGSGGRDIGVQIGGAWSGPVGVSYALAFINGAGINVSDNNNKKDIVGKVDVTPLKGLAVGGSAFRGSVENKGADALGESGFGGHGDYKHDLGLHLRAEVVTASFEVAGKPKKQPWGWYFQGDYAMPFHKPIEATARFDAYEEDKKSQDTSINTVTLGARYMIIGNTRIALNYLIRSADKNVSAAQEAAGTGSKIGNLLLLQLLAGF